MAVPKPDYLSRDYAGIRQSLLDYAGQFYPDWQPASEGDFGMVMVELFAYVGDILSYYTDRAQFENYLGSATQRDSVLGIAYLLGYVPNSGTPATGNVTLVTDVKAPAIIVPAGTKLTTARIEALDGPVTVETNSTVVLAALGAVNPPVAVIEGDTVSFTKIGESTGQPSQVFTLPHTGVYRNTVRVFVEDGTGSTVINPGTASQVTAREWTAVDHLLDADGSTTDFETQFNDKSMSVVFGDDINGAIPATGLQVFSTYRHGVGAQGNVPAGQVRLVNDSTLASVHVAKDSTGAFLSSGMSGGSDPESTDSIRYNAPRAYRTQNRALTLKDYRDVALGTEGVSKANALSGTFTSVTVYVVGADGGTPTDALKKAVSDRFKNKTLIGVTVSVAAPTFVPVNFGTVATPVSVELFSQYSQKDVQAAIKRELQAYINGLAFGTKLNVGKVHKLLDDIEGVSQVEIPVMARNDVAQVGVATLAPKAWEVFTMGTLNLAFTGGVA